jgi:hypothetical protein
MGRLGNLTICQIAEAKPPPVTKPTGADSTGGWREARGGDSTRPQGPVPTSKRQNVAPASSNDCAVAYRVTDSWGFLRCAMPSVSGAAALYRAGRGDP